MERASLPCTRDVETLGLLLNIGPQQSVRVYRARLKPFPIIPSKQIPSTNCHSHFKLDSKGTRRLNGFHKITELVHGTVNLELRSAVLYFHPGFH